MADAHRNRTGLTKQPRFRKIVDLLPRESNVITVLNIDSTISMAVDATRAYAESTPKPLWKNRSATSEPALIAASCAAHPAAVSGQVFASYEDIGRFIKLGGQFMEAAAPPGAAPLPPRPASHRPAGPDITVTPRV
jgi:hypothetical protein